MDCHEPNSHFKLVGVFKEVQGQYDFFEQLFKHEGYCIWSDDTYSFMQYRLEDWPTECRELTYPDYNGNSLYVHVQPIGE
eukprot:9733208-Ditylum_brightwellii.AAC.1